VLSLGVQCCILIVHSKETTASMHVHILPKCTHQRSGKALCARVCWGCACVFCTFTAPFIFSLFPSSEAATNLHGLPENLRVCLRVQRPPKRFRVFAEFCYWQQLKRRITFLWQRSSTAPAKSFSRRCWLVLSTASWRHDEACVLKLCECVCVCVCVCV
jgi:hypothetical protein